MKLSFTEDGAFWDVTVTDSDGNIIMSNRSVLTDDMRTIEYFMAWEQQIKSFPGLNITEVSHGITLL